MNTEFNAIIENLLAANGIYNHGPMGRRMRAKTAVEWVNHQGETHLSPVEEGRFALTSLVVCAGSPVVTWFGMGGVVEWTGDSVKDVIFRAKMYRLAVNKYQPGSPSRIVRILDIDTKQWHQVQDLV